MSDVIRVGVVGASGRMGSEVSRAVQDATGLELVARVDVGDSLDDLVRAGVQVVVDFTVPAAVLGTIRFCLDAGIHCVVGTSGFTGDRLAEVAELAAEHPAVGIIVAPNFGIGAVLMMQFAAKAAPFFQSVEIIEMHHPDKVDAPSGTAVQTARLIAAARARSDAGPMPDATASGWEARGSLVDGVRIHAVRVRGLVAHQEVILGSAGETLVLRHDSLDRASFMPGVLLAVRAVRDRPGLTVGIDDLLDQSA